MTHLLSPKRYFSSTRDAFDVHEAPLQPSSGKSEDCDHLSSLPSSSRRTSFSSASVSSRRFSVASYTNVPTDGYQLEVPRLTQTPWERERYKKKSSWRRSKPEYVFPAGIFKRLPREVYDCITDQLEQLHIEKDQSCACYLNDLFNLSLTSRAWDRAATSKLYRKVWVLTNNYCSKMPKLNIKGTGRLKLLRRTLRERPLLGRCVRELHMNDFLVLYQNASIDREEIVNLVASVVMACPNLERLVGFHIPYTHSFDRLSHALSTRRKLKARVWLLTENMDNDLDEDEEDELSNIYYQAECDPTERFLELNSSHTRLTTLILHQEACRPSVLLNFRAIIGTIRQLPALRYLSISGFPSSSFTNLTLNALPPNLKSLRLENLPGINDKGLKRFAESHLSTSLESVILIDVSISNLTTLSHFLSDDLANLEKFTLSQHNAPSLPFTDDIPLLKSQTLEYIHWEVRSQACPPPEHHSSTPGFPFPNTEPLSCLATSLLSTCIKNGHFPSLRRLRAPHDPQGLLQAQSKPLATALLGKDVPARRPVPSYISHHDGIAAFPFSPSLAGSPLPSPESRADSPMSASFDEPPIRTHKTQYSPTLMDNTSALSPVACRAAAQSRIVTARKTPFITIQVTDPEGVVCVEKKTGGFIGRLDSKIVYELCPDINRVIDEQGKEDGCENEWIVGVEDLVGKREAQESYFVCDKGHRVQGGGSAKIEDMF